MAILQGIPKSVFTWNFEIIAHDHVVTMVTIPWNKDSAFFNLDGHQYELSPEGWFANNYILKRDSVILTTTKRESFLNNAFKSTLISVN